jgi:hypothetical protein
MKFSGQRGIGLYVVENAHTTLVTTHFNFIKIIEYYFLLDFFKLSEIFFFSYGFLRDL